MNCHRLHQRLRIWWPISVMSMYDAPKMNGASSKGSLVEYYSRNPIPGPLVSRAPPPLLTRRTHDLGTGVRVVLAADVLLGEGVRARYHGPVNKKRTAP